MLCDVQHGKEYESDTITVAYSKGSLYGRNDRIGKERLYDLLEEMNRYYHEKGWTKEDFEMYAESEFAYYYIG